MVDPVGHRSHEARLTLLRIFIKTLFAVAVVFVLVRIVSPSLMDDHNDIAFWSGVLCWPLAVIVAVGGLVWIARDIRGLGAPHILPKRLPERD